MSAVVTFGVALRHGEYRTMKWEYKTVRYESAGLFSTKSKTDEPDRLLNQLGVDGWGLAATLHPTTGSAENLLIFKRATLERA
jgi:hypothetical protein